MVNSARSLALADVLNYLDIMHLISWALLDDAGIRTIIDEGQSHLSRQDISI
jgi:hypothetical protein